MIKLLLFYEFILQQAKTKLKYSKCDTNNSTSLGKCS